MNRAIFCRLMWKEYRLQRAFWIAMSVLALMLMLLAWQFNDRVDERNLWFFYIALATPVFFVLGCASTTFAGEYDAETYEFQRSLPATAMQVFWSKIALAFLSTFAMFLVLCVLAFCLAGGRLPMEKYVTIWEMRIWDTLVIACMGAWLYMVWGVFFSLILKRPLLAAIVGVTVASMGSYAVAGIMQIPFPSKSLLPMQMFAGLSGLLAIVNILIGRGWFKEKMWSAFGTNLPKNAGISSTSKSMTLEQYISRPNFWTIFRRLTWQHWRQSRWLVIVVLVMLAPLIFAFIQLWWINNKYWRSGNIRYHDWVDFCMTISMPLAVAMPPLVASFTFLADQRQRSLRFFAQRGISSRMLWFSRLLPWLVIIVPFCLVAILAYFSTYIFLNHVGRPRGHEEWFAISLCILFLFGYLMLSLCVGQFCSMYFRSGFLAGLFSLIITALLILWAAYMWMCGINFLWSVLPIPVILLLATWLRAPDWILDRNTFASWLRPGLVLAVPAVVLLTVVPLYRVYKIPAVDPGFSISEFERPLTPEEEATRRLFEKADQRMDWTIWNEMEKEEADAIQQNAEDEGKQARFFEIPKTLSAKEISFVQANQETISLLVEASKGAERIASNNYSTDGLLSLNSGTTNLLIDSAMILESDGQLDAALERYLSAIRIAKKFDIIWGQGDYLERLVYAHLPHWANRSGQTPERIKNAIRQVEKLTADMPARDGEIKFNYIRMMESIREGLHNTPILQNPVPFLARIPWERARALRLLNLITRQNIESVRRAEEDVKAGKPIGIHLEREQYRYSFTNFLIDRELLGDYFWQMDFSINQQYANMENNRRATLIVLALQAWKLEHGDYPKTLDELVGPYFEKLPNDPYSGDSYQYFPKGVKDWMYGLGMDFELLSPGKGKPVVWSTDLAIQLKSIQYPFLNKYWIYDRDREGLRWRDPTSMYDILSHGQCFLVP
jgi:hypothetical protein